MNVFFSSKMVSFAIVLFLGLNSFSVKAGCSIGSQAQTIQFPAITITPSDRGSVGTVLYSTSIQVGQINFSCGSGVKSSWRSFYTRAEASKTAIDNVYSTNVAGIGLRIKWPQSRSDNAWVPGSYSCQGNCIEPADKMVLEFVQTGVASSGTIPAGAIVGISVSPDSEPGNTLTLLNISLGEVTVSTRSCAIYASTNNVDLGEYSLADVIKTNFSGEKKDFTITLDCPAETSAKITFEGRTAWGMDTGVIENAGDAKNAYIRLYQKSGQRYTAKAINTEASFGSSAAFTGKRTVTYAGEMYFDDSTRANATAGSVTANVIYTLTLN
ncbi:fimbrial protein [Kalamiella sp. sgz302252]|uniref:fimbrial protein n=1 Tax=Pantoea sp. sgz302252 TaxID=3341827 RepID=UPI0036D2F53A